MRTGEESRESEAGFTVVSAMVAMAVTLVMVTWFSNLFVHRYAQGVIRQATDEAAAAWANHGGTHADCVNTANEALDDLLGGPLGGDISIRCTLVGNTVEVAATGTLAAIGPMPDANVNTTATATTELEDGLTTP